MKTITCVLSILAVASTAALAKDLKQNKKATTNAPAVSATQLNDAEMDKVTAGAGIGHAYAFGQNVGPGWLSNNGLGKNH